MMSVDKILLVRSVATSKSDTDDENVVNNKHVAETAMVTAPVGHGERIAGTLRHLHPAGGHPGGRREPGL